MCKSSSLTKELYYNANKLHHQAVLDELQQLPKEEIIVIYHGGCPDGLTSAAIAYDALNKSDKVTFVPGAYARPLDQEQLNIDDKTIIFCDFSYKYEEMAFIASKVRQLIFLDHHEAQILALESLFLLPNVFRHASIEYSGASLTWSFFHSLDNRPVPLFVKYIEDGDLYTFELQNSRNIIRGLHSLLSKEIAENVKYLEDMYLNYHLESISLIGKALNEVSKKEAQNIIKNCRITVEAFGFKVPAVNATPDHTNLIGELISTTEDVPFVLIYTVYSDKVKISLRSTEQANQKVNLGILAKQHLEKNGFSGGGHATAGAGFMAIEEFYETILSKRIN